MNPFLHNPANPLFVHPPCICPPRHSKRSHGLEIVSYKPMVEIRTLDAGTYARVYSIAYDSSGTELAAGTQKIFSILENGEVKIWKGSQAKPRTLDTEDKVTDIAYNPNGRQLAAGLENGDVVIWNTSTWKNRTLKQGLVEGWIPGGKGSYLAYNPSGKQLAIGFSDGYVELRNAETLKLETLMDTNKTRRGEHPDRFWLHIFCIAYSPDGKNLAAGLENQVKIWNTSTGKEVLTLNIKDKVAYSIAYNPTGTRLATGLRDGRVIIWDTATWKESRILDTEDNANSIAYSPKGNYFATGLHNGLVKIWDTNSWSIRALEAWSSVWSVAFNPVDNTIAAGLENGKVVEWDLSNFNVKN